MPYKFTNPPGKDTLPLPTGQTVVKEGDTIRNVPASEVAAAVDISQLQERIRNAPIQLPAGVDPSEAFTTPYNAPTASEQPPVKQEELDSGDPDKKPEPETVSLYDACPRCSLDLSEKYEIDLTDDDKSQFLMAILGGRPFSRNYPLFGGRMIAVFRTLTAVEEQAIKQHLIDETKAGKITSQTEWLAWTATYRLATSLSGIKGENGVQDYQATAIDEASPAEAYLRLLKDAARSEVLMHAFAHQYALFRRKVEALESNADNPSFWQGIA